MAMNKKEAAEMEALRTELRVAKALRHSNAMPPATVPPPKSSGDYVNGWQFNTSPGCIYGAVFKAWSGAVSHGYGEWVEDAKDPDGRLRRHVRGSQGEIEVYPSKHAAALALRLALETEFARRLAAVDAIIEGRDYAG